MAFHDIRLPDDVEQGATGGPQFETSILPMSSGNEQRNINWEDPLHSYELSYGVQNDRDFGACRAFFFARRGKAHSFRFKDWGDYWMEDEPQGVGDGVNAVFQLIKTYELDGPLPYIRRIRRPIPETVQYFIDDVPVGHTPGLLGLNTLASVPADGALVTADCEFDVRVRFDVDKFNLKLSQPGAGAIGSLPVIEVRE